MVVTYRACFPLSVVSSDILFLCRPLEVSRLYRAAVYVLGVRACLRACAYVCLLQYCFTLVEFPPLYLLLLLFIRFVPNLLHLLLRSDAGRSFHSIREVGWR